MRDSDVVSQITDSAATCPCVVMALSSAQDFPFVTLFHFLIVVVPFVVCGLVALVVHRVLSSWLLQTAWSDSGAVSTASELGLPQTGTEVWEICVGSRHQRK